MLARIDCLANLPCSSSIDSIGIFIHTHSAHPEFAGKLMLGDAY
jgi:hypothetical protein